MSRDAIKRAESQLLAETEGVRDEISFLAIHQAYSDRLFPGTSVLASEMLQTKATKTLQTSLMSKFAFSLRPELIVPYDIRVRLGLGEMFGRKLNDHDYPAYLQAFQAFASESAVHPSSSLGEPLGRDDPSHQDKP